MRRVIGLSALVLMTVAYADKSVPVMVGGNADFDACGSWGKVQGLDIRGEGFLAVRKGPGSKYRMIDKLHNGDGVWFCDSRGKWVGVIYGKNCNVSSPIVQRKPYNGSCKSGWAFEKWLVLTAG